jgi:hypothetical protein
VNQVGARALAVLALHQEPLLEVAARGDRHIQVAQAAVGASTLINQQ